MNARASKFSKVGFLGWSLLPALLIFVIPGFSFWFFRYAERRMDDNARVAILQGIENDAEATPEERARAREFFEKVPVSRILANRNPETADLRASLVGTGGRHYAIFRWLIRISFVCLASGVVVFILACLSVLFSLRSQFVQYVSLSVGWHALRLFSLIQVVGQGILASALSFYITAVWAERYYVKLVGAISLLSLAAVVLLLGAVFRRLKREFEVEGELLSEPDAPALWAHISKAAEELGTEKPRQLIAGIDDNFFVTEHPVVVGGKKYEGRTLFISLALLKHLSKSEANAVLAHELAHFSGNDTLYSKKISPLLGRYHAYLAALHAGVLSRPIFYFMLFFWNLYQVSLNRLSRRREFRADAIAAKSTSPADIANSLARIAAYSSYRGEVEREMFGKEEVLQSVNIVEKIASGFPQYVKSFIAQDDLGGVETAHPFDSHPPLQQRFEAVGLKLDPAAIEEVLARPVEDSWHREIDGAAEKERAQWAKYEAEFQKAHEESLPYRYLPATDEERAVVEKHFPPAALANKKGETIAIDYKQIAAPGRAEPIEFDSIANITQEESLGKKYLKIEFGEKGKEKLKFCVSGYSASADEVVNLVGRYYGRHRASRDYLKSKAESAAAEQAKPQEPPPPPPPPPSMPPEN